MRTLEQLEKEIRDPRGIWYGPHQCEGCNRIIVKRATEQGPLLALDAESFNRNYPNFVWHEHVCTPSGLPIGQAGGEARSASMTSEERSEAASKAAKKRWKLQPHLDMKREFVDQAYLDMCYQQFAMDGVVSDLQANGAPVFVVKLTRAAHRKLIKEDASMRQDFMFLEGGERWQKVGVNTAYGGWAHWIDG